jgi:RNA polymerase-binding protein DksA
VAPPVRVEEELQRRAPTVRSGDSCRGASVPGFAALFVAHPSDEDYIAGMSLDAPTTQALRRKLLSQCAALTQRHAVTVQGEAEMQDNRSPDWEDQASADHVEELLGQMGDRERAQLQRIVAALRRVEAGVYGTCSSCDGPIALARLEAMPETELCIDCARSA